MPSLRVERARGSAGVHAQDRRCSGAAIRFRPTRPRNAAVPDTHGPLAVSTSKLPQSLATLSDLRPLGQIHDSFIIAAGRDGLWIIDQHVAHERILFEKVLRQQAEGRVERQHLLMPILLEVTPSQQIEYARIAERTRTRRASIPSRSAIAPSP